MLQYGMPTLIEIDSLEDTIKLCKELDLSFLELNMNLPQYQIEQLENIEYLKELKEKYQIGFTIHLDENLNVCDFNKAVANAYSETVYRAIQVAKQLNVPILNMHMNHGVHFTLPDRKVQLFKQYFNDYMKSFEEFRAGCEKAIGDSDIKICIENTDGYKEYEVSAVEYLLKSHVFGLTWDIGHSNAVNNVDEKLIMDNKNKLYHFHIHDSLGKKDHMTLGTGEINLNQRFQVAKECNCGLVVETKTVAALKESVSWLDRNGLR
jgi:sugar phosphate isomerase/epimerase